MPSRVVRQIERNSRYQPPPGFVLGGSQQLGDDGRDLRPFLQARIIESAAVGSPGLAVVWHTLLVSTATWRLSDCKYGAIRDSCDPLETYPQ
jgi:hypothetical protein